MALIAANLALLFRDKMAALVGIKRNIRMNALWRQNAQFSIHRVTKLRECTYKNVGIAFQLS